MSSSNPISFRPSKFSTWRVADDAKPLVVPWRWPLSRLADREPLVIAEHVNEERRTLELGYESRFFDAELYVPVSAAQAGEVALAGETPSGFMITIDHGHREWATHYTHLSRMFVAPYLGQKKRRRQRVQAGEVIAYAAKTPIRMRFELWNWTDEKGFVPVDPIATMTSWGVKKLGGMGGMKEAA
jgi:murein DD-endopeptidase MepM/ murein hydrolase activator NlpD